MFYSKNIQPYASRPVTAASKPPLPLYLRENTSKISRFQ